MRRVLSLFLFAALLAVWIASNFKKRTARAVLVSIAIVQLAVTGSRIRQNPYRNSYLEAGRLLQTHAANGATVFASAEWVAWAAAVSRQW